VEQILHEWDDLRGSRLVPRPPSWCSPRHFRRSTGTRLPGLGRSVRSRSSPRGSSCQEGQTRRATDVRQRTRRKKTYNLDKITTKYRNV